MEGVRRRRARRGDGCTAGARVSSRTYSAQAGPDVSLYVAYYGAQRPGASIHSPLHCLPGTGWEPVDVTTVPLRDGWVPRDDAEGPRSGGRLLLVPIAGTRRRQRVRSKVYGLFERVRSGRSEAALVRIVVPIAGDANDAAAQGLSFRARCCRGSHRCCRRFDVVAFGGCLLCRNRVRLWHGADQGRPVHQGRRRVRRRGPQLRGGDSIPQRHQADARFVVGLP